MKNDIRSTIEIIGIFGVIASLIFVGMQIMLDRRIAMAEQYSNRAESEKADIRARLESEDYFNMREEEWMGGIRPFWWTENSEVANQISEGRKSVRSLFFEIESVRLILIGYDNEYYQYELGLIAEDYWGIVRGVIKSGIQRDFIYCNQISASRRPIQAEIELIFGELEAEYGHSPC